MTAPFYRPREVLLTAIRHGYTVGAQPSTTEPSIYSGPLPTEGTCGRPHS